ncbi:hypothetical protein N7474_006484 [Penicillium riverlandense]|uniref:uncharacterized protein n=1 Tax=Penicillium riverlandense TaxID=1903569 RepID=UPI00254714C0|nr:uncharacterized protein N7474_006484 [Penicillium riverlandense]KAJ5814707.1 hypothetical protein N7474_006484 [Penicillium riverlandense]
MFFHLCGHLVHATITHPTALVASSCMARLYEEILCREDIVYLLPIHNWFISVGCLPQIHALSGRFYADATCQEELDILLKALKTMGIKWPQAKNLRNAVDRLVKKRVSRPQVAESRETDRPEYLVDGGSAHLNGFVRELFPFPETMCPRIAMLDSVDPIPNLEENIGERPPLWDEDYQFNWVLDASGLNPLNESFENFSNLYPTGNGLNF